MTTFTTRYHALLLSATLFAGSSALAQDFPRTVLIEEFTSVTCAPCVEVTPLINAAVSASGGRAVSTRFHVNNPRPGDPWYKASQSIVDARSEYYVPGNSVNPPLFLVDGRTLSQKEDISPEVTDRLSIKSPIKMEVTQQMTIENVVNVVVKVTAGADGLSGDHKLRVVAVESYIKDETVDNIPFHNGEHEFYDVVRTMLPTSDGQAISLEPNQSKTFNLTYTRGTGWQSNQMFVVAYVQNENPSGQYSIVQSGYSALPAGVYEPTPLVGFSLADATPSPARTEATIGYSIGSSANVLIELRDIAGALVKSVDEGMKERGDHQARISLGDLPSGTYTYTLRAGDYMASRRMVVVK